MTSMDNKVSWTTPTDGFNKAVLLLFGPTDYEDPFEAQSRLKQTRTVATYQEAVEKLSHQFDGLRESFLIGCFIAGLRDDMSRRKNQTTWDIN